MDLVTEVLNLIRMAEQYKPRLAGKTVWERQKDRVKRVLYVEGLAMLSEDMQNGDACEAPAEEESCQESIKTLKEKLESLSQRRLYVISESSKGNT